MTTAKPRRVRAQSNSKLPVTDTSGLGVLKKMGVGRYIAMAMKEYGTEVVEERAIPDYRDGLKPVQRMLLWAAYKLGMHNNKGFKKSARIVGEVIGKYHPHGDAAAYQAMVGLTGTKHQGEKSGWYTRNCTVPLFEGQGNWGDFVDKAAHYRYTETRLSLFSDHFLLDPDYLAVSDYVPNYDDSERVPVILPAKLPVALLNGYSSIGVGVAAASPPFSFDGVLKLTIKALRGDTITAMECAKTLVPEHAYGGETVSTPKELLPTIKGKGSITYRPTYVVDEKKRTLVFRSVCPGLMSTASIEKFLNKLAAHSSVATVHDETDRRGPWYEVQAKRGVAGAKFDAMVADCVALSTRSDSYDIGITIRHKDGGAEFGLSDVPTILRMWAEWRIELELRVIQRLIQQQEGKLKYLTALRSAAVNLEVVMQALRVKADKVAVVIDGVSREVDGAAAYLMKKLKLDLVSAETILDMKVRQLRAIEVAALDAKIAACNKELASLSKSKKNPSDRAITDLLSLSKLKL